LNVFLDLLSFFLSFCPSDMPYSVQPRYHLLRS